MRSRLPFLIFRLTLLTYVVASTNIAFAVPQTPEQKAASASDDQLITWYTHAIFTYASVGLLKARDDVAAGAPAASESVAKNNIFHYEAATAALLGYDLTKDATPPTFFQNLIGEDGECRDFIALDVRAHRLLRESLNDYLSFEELTFNPLLRTRQKARIRILQAIVEQLGDLVRTQREASEGGYFAEIPGTPCFSPSRQQEWKDAHVKLLKIEDLAVTDTIGKPSLEELNELPQELTAVAAENPDDEAELKLEGKWFPLAVELGLWIWPPSKFFKAIEWTGKVKTVALGTYSAIVAAIFANNAQGMNLYDPKQREGVLTFSNKFLESTYISSQQLVAILNMMAAKKIEALSKPVFKRIGDELTATFGSPEKAYAKLPEIERRTDILTDEMKKRGMEASLLDPRQLAQEFMESSSQVKN